MLRFDDETDAWVVAALDEDGRDGAQMSVPFQNLVSSALVGDGEPPNKRGRKEHFDESAKTWIRAERRQFLSHDKCGSLPAVTLRQLLKQGQDGGHLPESATYEQLRHFCTKVRQCMMNNKERI
jgi:hypothetical protein